MCLLVFINQSIKTYFVFQIPSFGGWWRQILRMRLWKVKWTRLVPILAILLTFTFFIIDTYFVTCVLRTCDINEPKNIDQDSIENKNALSDLNGIEICLSIKFVDPIQRLELEGSPQLGKNGPYSVVYNYLKSSRFYGENETVTYTTHSTPEFMEHIGGIAERWDGPVSVALYVPFTDYCRAVHKMIYLRNCDKAAYREKVTWHIFWAKDSPPTSSWSLVPDETQVDCDKLASDYKHNEDLKKTWRTVQKSLYPVNVGRNVARQASTTWFVLPSDVELYPSLGLATQFIEYIQHGHSKNVKPVKSSIPIDKPLTPVSKVYVVPVFEALKSIPDTKEELMIQYVRHTAVYFHKLVCQHCQNFPGLGEWITNPGTPNKMHVSYVVIYKFVHILTSSYNCIALYNLFYSSIVLKHIIYELFY